MGGKCWPTNGWESRSSENISSQKELGLTSGLPLGICNIGHSMRTPTRWLSIEREIGTGQFGRAGLEIPARVFGMFVEMAKSLGEYIVY
jgi:hypothetical protein